MSMTAQPAESIIDCGDEKSGTSITAAADESMAASPPAAAPQGVAPLVAMVASGQFTTETIRELMVLQREHDSHEARKAYHEAMPRARGAMQVAVKGKKNDHLRTTYATLDDLIAASAQALATNGFNFSWSIAQGEGQVTATCQMTHAGGHTESVSVSMPVEKGLTSKSGNVVVNAAQAMGIAITYAKRYSFSALVGVATEDHDGNARAASPPPAAITDAQESELVTLLDEIEALIPGNRKRFRDGPAKSFAAAETPLGMIVPAEKFNKVRDALRAKLTEAKAKTEASESSS